MSGSREYRGRFVKGPAKSSIIVRDRNLDGLGKRRYFWRRKRILVSILAFFGIFNMFTNRADLSIAITRMVKHHMDNQNKTGADFDWTVQQEGLVLSSFFYGYICLQFFGGWLASRVGGVMLFGFGVGMPSFVAVFTEYFARSSYIALIVLRALQGLLQGVCYPSLHDIWAHWLPPLERTGLAALTYSGAYLGVAFTMIVSGYVLEYLSWPAVFHIFGGLGTAWYGLWLAFIYRIPEDDMHLDPFELEYLQTHLVTKFERVTPPWRRIFTTRSVYALIISHFALSWVTNTLLTELPIFMRDVLDYEIVETGFYASIPYLVLFIAIIISGFSVNIILKKNIATTTHVRKIYICTGFLIQGVLMFFVGYVKSRTFCILLVTIGMAGSALSEPNIL